MKINQKRKQKKKKNEKKKGENQIKNLKKKN
jgi:hypothetical protein